VRAANPADGEGVAVQVAVEAGGVGDDVAGGREGIGLGKPVGVIKGHGGVVFRGDVDGDGAGGGAALAVGDGVGDDDRAIDVGGGVEGQGAVGVDHDVPLAGSTVAPVTVRVSPSGSVSLPSTLKVTGWSSLVVAVSGLASGRRWCR
jgi:hypothetical protein